VTSWAHVVWYTARASGYTAFVLLTAAVVLGLLLSLRAGSPRWPRFLTNELHRFVTVLALGFTAVHGVALLLDPVMGFAWTDLVVPFAGRYRPLPMALGITAAYLMVAVWASSRVQRRIGYRLWRRLHFVTFAVYLLALGHTALVGEDASTAWGAGIDAASLAAVGGLTIARLLGVGRAAATGHPRAALVTTAATTFGATVILAGPLSLAGR
jgi:predicted ferric reductase